MRTAVSLALAFTAIGAAARADEAPASLSPTPPLAVDCRGAASASPTVILESGAFGTSADWDYILDDLSDKGRACAFDRAGLGRSPDRPGDKGVLGKAAELVALLDQLGETGRVILVGHSNGGLYVEAFARLFPARVAGLVYVNGVNASAAENPRLVKDLTTERKLSNLAVTAAHLGLAGLVADQLVGGESLEKPAAARKRHALTCAPCLKVSRDEDRLIVPGLSVVGQLDDAEARRVPTVVIVGAPRPDDRLARAWRAAEVRPATLAARSWVLDAPGASHTSPLARDRAYVSAAIAWLRQPFTTPPRSASIATAPPE